MTKATITALRILLTVALAGSVAVQALILPLLWLDLADEQLWGRITVVVLLGAGIVTLQVVGVCVWLLLTSVRRGAIFRASSFGPINVIIGAILAAAVLTWALAAVFAAGTVAPGVVALVGGAGVVIAGAALLVVVMKTLLRQAIERDAEARALQTELDDECSRTGARRPCASRRSTPCARRWTASPVTSCAGYRTKADHTPSGRDIEARPSAQPRYLPRVDPRRREEPGPTGHAGTLDNDLPAVVMDAVVTGLAEQDPVREIGRTSVPLPPAEVMSLRHPRRKPAHRAPAVPLGEGQALGSGEEALLATPVQDLARPAEDAGDDAPTGRHPPHGTDVDHLVEPVDRRRPGSCLQVVQRYPDDHRRAGEREPISLTPEHVRAEEGQRVGLDHRDGAPVCVSRRAIGSVEAGGEHGGHMSPDRGDDRRRGLGIELRVQVHHAVTFEDAQSTPSALLLRPRRDAVGVEPRFGAEDELAHGIELEPFGCACQHTLRLGDALHPGGHATAIQQGDEETSRRRSEGTRRERFPEERVPRGQRRTEQIAPR
ncbi:unnamed protein product [Penicillium discolor]